MVIQLDHWTFTDLDTRRTIEVLDEVMSHAAHGRPAGLFDDHADQAQRLQRGLSEGVHAGELLAEAWGLIRSVRTTICAAGLVPARHEARVAGLFTSSGGVPKLAVDAVDIGYSGVAGDRQATRRHHGRPWQALCLWSHEVVEHLAGQGHPIRPGAAGENVSIAGLDWSQVRPGVRLAFGEVECEISAYAIPCRKNDRWFEDRSSAHIHHDRGSVSRVYATVLAPGSIRIGESAVLESEREHIDAPRR